MQRISAGMEILSLDVNFAKAHVNIGKKNSSARPPLERSHIARSPTLTQGGTFHCDDLFAYANPRVTLHGGNYALIQTRDPAQIASAGIGRNVCPIDEASIGRFNHHRLGASVRNDTETPFRSTRFAWQVHGEQAVSALDAFASISGIPDRGFARRCLFWGAAQSRAGGAFPMATTLIESA
jgi:hypothetical protein